MRQLFLILALALASHAQLVVPVTSQCATSTDGTVVGVLNPLHPPTTAPVFSGTLGAGTYFIEIAWYDAAGHVTLPSSEVQQQLVSTGEIQVTPPIGMPATALGMRVYIGTSSGAETLQGSTVGSAVFTQSTPLSAGTAPPASNTTVCSVVANDAGWPTGTGYDVSLTTPSGITLPGYPLQAQFLGPGNTINLSQGFPFYNGVVTYPVPILSRPYGHGPQSIAGPLDLTGYNLTSVNRLGIGTKVPGWGVDAEGAGINGAVNANTGYLFNGAAPLNHVLLGNGSYYVDSATIPASTIGNLFYQTMDASGSAQTQRSALNFNAYFTLSDSASPSRTTVAPVTSGSAAKLVTAAAPGSSTALAQWDGAGNIQPAGATICGGVTNSTASGCTVLADGSILQWKMGSADGADASSKQPPLYSQSVVWPVAFSTACYAPWVTIVTVSSNAVNWWYQLTASSASGASVQRQTVQDDAGVGGSWSGGTTTPIVYCIGK